MFGIAQYVRSWIRPKGPSTEELNAYQRIGKRVVEGIKHHIHATWTSQDGRETLVRGMSPSHLHYALAKGYRGEYIDGSIAKRNFPALEAEALRRLVKAHYPISFMAPNADGSYRGLYPGSQPLRAIDLDALHRGRS